MTTTIKWDDSYCVNDPHLDKQHKHLFDLVNSVPEELQRTPARQVVLQLFAYTSEHFEDEERMMKEIEYPDIARHKELHANLLSQLSQIARHNFPDDQSLIEFKKFASDWLSEHVLEADMNYFTFVKNSDTDR